MTLSFNAVTLRGPNGEVIGSTGTARDVTEQKRVEDAVAAKHRQMQAIIDNSPLVIYAKDASHRYLLANRELEVQLSLPPGGAVGRSDFDLLPETEAERRRAGDQRVLDSCRRPRGGGAAGHRRPRAHLPGAPLPAAARPTARSTPCAAWAPT